MTVGAPKSSRKMPSTACLPSLHISNVTLHLESHTNSLHIKYLAYYQGGIGEDRGMPKELDCFSLRVPPAFWIE